MHYNGCNYLSMLGLKLNHVSKRGHRSLYKNYFLPSLLGHTCVPRLRWARLTLITSEPPLSAIHCLPITLPCVKYTLPPGYASRLGNNPCTWFVYGIQRMPGMVVMSFQSYYRRKLPTVSSCKIAQNTSWWLQHRLNQQHIGSHFALCREKRVIFMGNGFI